MFIHKLNRITKIIAAIIFTVIVFTFLHSEAGLLNYDGDNHGTHDYCEIVKTATNKITKDVSKDIYKLPVDKSIYFHCIDETNQHSKSISILGSEQFYTPQKTTKVYLFNRTFLI
ncbi:hypothetical protein ACSSV9_14375 [Melioribacter sp. OK-6-Me]|uniref:Uncharacterized protein n=1 Tax=Ignavibacterium album TaxID=591197 RepID=A0A7V3E7N4_9BACT